MVRDPADRERLLSTDTDRHTVLMMMGVSDVDRVTGARLHELAAPPGEGPQYRVEIDTEGIRWTAAVVVAIDKLPARPTEAAVHNVGFSQPATFGVAGGSGPWELAIPSR